MPLQTLSGLHALRPAIIKQAMHDSHFALRVHALRLAEEHFEPNPDLVDALFELVDDESPRVRLQLALTLGETSDPRAAATLAALALECGDDPWMSAAILCSSASSAAPMLATMLANGENAREHQTMIHSLGSIAGASGDLSQIGMVLKSLADLAENGPVEVTHSALNGLNEGLGRAGRKLTGDAEMVSPVQLLLLRSDVDTRRLTVQVASALNLQNLAEMNAVFTESRERVTDENTSIEERKAALLLLSFAPLEQWATVAETLLGPQQPLDLQLAAVEALIPEKRRTDRGHAPWRDFDPTHRPFARPSSTHSSNATTGWIFCSPPSRRRPFPPRPSTRSAESNSCGIPNWVNELQNVWPTRAEKAAVRKCLPGTSRHSSCLVIHNLAGRVFEQHCQKCHKLGTEGFEVGPDLLAARTRADETLISDVMDPSNQITVGYDSYTVLSVDGRIFTGVLAEETATSITLKKEEAAKEVILRKNIDEMEASQLSMMPENLEEQVTPQDLAHLLGFLRNTIGSASSEVLVLFEDDAGFPSLPRGRQRVVPNSTAPMPFPETRPWPSLHPNASPLAFPNGRFPSARTPARASTAISRFAWKQRSGHGAMLELADDGRWPPAESPRQRYFAGKNTTDWAATRVDEESPAEWTVVQRDLWADFGNFTLTGLAPTAMGG